jgi:hypothetical protein
MICAWAKQVVGLPSSGCILFGSPGDLSPKTISPHLKDNHDRTKVLPQLKGLTISTLFVPPGILELKLLLSRHLYRLSNELT